jgi:hypothetical protein
LARIIETRRAPASIRSDYDPERSSRHFVVWRIDAIHIKLSKPTQNAHLKVFMAGGGHRGTRISNG